MPVLSSLAAPVIPSPLIADAQHARIGAYYMSCVGQIYAAKC